MEALSPRPKLISFRATSFSGENKAASSGNEPWIIELKQTIEIGLATLKGPSAPLQAVVVIDLQAKASKAEGLSQAAIFSASYEAKFVYPAGTQDASVSLVFDQEPYQYMLIAQAFPLAMTHFRRELQSMGFDARELPLGL